ncbi:hypothetical protein ABK040_016784 [Willaertia magna]
MPLHEFHCYSHPEINISKNEIQLIENEYIIKFIKFSYNTIFIVTDEGTVFVKGNNEYGQLGTSDFNNKDEFTIINFNEPIKLLELEDKYSIIVTENNDLFFTGQFKYLFNNKEINKFTKIEEYNINEKINLIKCVNFNIFIVTENIYVIGDNKYNQLGLDENKEYFEFTKINKFINNDNIVKKLFVKNIICQLFDGSSFILDLDGNIYKSNKLKYFTKLNLPFKVKQIFNLYLEFISFIIFLTNKNELYFLNNSEEYEQLIINDIEINEVNVFSEYLFIINKENKIFYNKVNNIENFNNSSMKLLDNFNYNYVQIINDNYKGYIYLNSYKINCNENNKKRIVPLTIFNYLNNLNIDNILNLLKNKYLNNQNDFINLIKNNFSNNFLNSFKSKEYNYEFSFIIIFNLTLLQIISKNKLNVNFNNLNNLKNVEELYIILNTIYFIINKNLPKNKYHINYLINIFKNKINFNNLFNNLNQELIYCLHNFMFTIKSLQNISLKLENKSLNVIFKNELKINVENNKFIIDNKYLKILFDNNFYNNLLNEIDLISKLNHLNIIEYLDYGKYKLNDMEYPYIVMKLSIAVNAISVYIK